MSQAVVMYVTLASNVSLICWFGTQLTQHVSGNTFIIIIIIFIIIIIIIITITEAYRECSELPID